MTIGTPYLAGWSRAACHGPVTSVGWLADVEAHLAVGAEVSFRSDRRVAASWRMRSRSGVVRAAYMMGTFRCRAAAYLNNRLQGMRGRPCFRGGQACAPAPHP
jgi:hypothetical protein